MNDIKDQDNNLAYESREEQNTGPGTQPGGSGQPVYYQADYGQPVYYQDGNTAPKTNGMATASLVMGILSLILCCSCLGGVIGGIMAICFAIASRSEGEMNSAAKAGLVLGIIGLVLTALVWGALLIYLMADFVGEAGSVVLPTEPELEQELPALDDLLLMFRQIRLKV